MKKHIEKIKLKPEKERKKIAGIFAGIVTFLIIIIWLLLMSLLPKQPQKSLFNEKQFKVLFNKLDTISSFVKKELNKEKKCDNKVEKEKLKTMVTSQRNLGVEENPVYVDSFE